jgi:glycerophosphoryl diester phosphodiesterase
MNPTSVTLVVAVALMSPLTTAAPAPAAQLEAVLLGPRPLYLVDDMDESELRATLRRCAAGPFERTDFSIGHRGAPLQFPEHTEESYRAAARMGAGILECDVTFTQDEQLVCRHSQCDLHTTTNILAVPELAAKCRQPFTPADPQLGTPASAMCCTSDVTLAEFKTLEGRMDAANPAATTVAEYLSGTADGRIDLYSPGKLLSHAESIALFASLGVKFTPELKAPSVAMPFGGDYTQADYAQQLIDEYKTAGVDPKDVFVQSFELDDVRYWIEHEPEFGEQAIYLDDRYEEWGFDHADPSTWSPTMAELAAAGINIIAPPIWMLVELSHDQEIIPSKYAHAAKAAGLDIITWTLERSGSLGEGGGWYYRTISEAIDNDGDMLVLLDVLARQVGIRGIFSDWPATVTYYANCMGLE